MNRPDSEPVSIGMMWLFFRRRESHARGFGRSKPAGGGTGSVRMGLGLLPLNRFLRALCGLPVWDLNRDFWVLLLLSSLS